MEKFGEYTEKDWCDMYHVFLEDLLDLVGGCELKMNGSQDTCDDCPFGMDLR